MQLPRRDIIVGLTIALHHSGNRRMPNMHYHDSFEIDIIEAGERSYIVENQLIHLTPRDVLLIKPDVHHCSVGGDYVLSAISFQYSYLQKFFNQYAIDLITKCFEKQVIRIRESDFPKFISLLEKMSECEDDILSFLHLLIILEDNMSRKTYDFKNAEPKIADILDYITENYKDIDKLDILVEKFYISKQHLCNLFKEHTGTTIMSYINVLKIHASFDLLANKSLTIAQVAEKSGFNSVSNFCNIFKNITGVSPSKYINTK